MAPILGVTDWAPMGVFKEEGDFQEYLTVYLCSIAVSFIAYFVSEAVYPGLMEALLGKENAYAKMKPQAQAEYHSRNVSDVHAIVAAPLAVYSCFSVCANPDDNIFSSQQCLMTPTKAQLYLVSISAGYVTYDLVIIFWKLGYTVKTGGDFVVHHIVGLVGALAVMISGRFNVALSAGNLVSEWSNLIMNLRWRMLKHKMTEGLPFLVVNAIFMLSYIIVRIVFMLMLLIRNYQIQQVFDIYSDPPAVYSCAIVSLVLQVSLYLIQIYWFKLIVGAFLRTLRGHKPMI